MRMRVAVVTMETGLFIFCACADNHVALLFINKVGGSRRSLSSTNKKTTLERADLHSSPVRKTRLKRN